jgi:hypothetical protein
MIMLTRVGLSCALLLGTAALATAQTATTLTPAPSAVTRQHLTEAEFTKRLEAEGFANVRDVKPAPDGYSAMATKDGKAIRVGLDQDNKIQVYSEQ